MYMCFITFLSTLWKIAPSLFRQMRTLCNVSCIVRSHCTACKWWCMPTPSHLPCKHLVLNRRISLYAFQCVLATLWCSTSKANRRFRKRWQRPQILQFCGDSRLIRWESGLVRTCILLIRRSSLQNCKIWSRLHLLRNRLLQDWWSYWNACLSVNLVLCRLWVLCRLLIACGAPWPTAYGAIDDFVKDGDGLRSCIFAGTTDV